MFMSLVWPTLLKAIQNKGFEPGLISNEGMGDNVYILLSPEHACPQSEKPFRKTVIDLLTQYHIPFEDESNELYALIFIDLIKLKPWEE
jgi:hypothetical protein